MPCASDGIRQVLVERESEEGLSLDTVVSGQDSHQNLHTPEDHHHIEILQSRTLRGRWLEHKKWIALRIRPMNEFLFLRRIPPDKSADSSQQSDEAQYAPQNRARCWHVADQRLMRPVVRVGRFRAGAIRAASPRSPPEKRGKLMLLCGIRQCAAGDRILQTGPSQKRRCNRARSCSNAAARSALSVTRLREASYVLVRISRIRRALKMAC